MITLEVNNGCRLVVDYDYNKAQTVVTKFDHNGIEIDSYGISDGDFVTMLNWYRYQKDNGNKDLYFPCVKTDDYKPKFLRER